jgi:hypothetical protein
MGWDPAVLRKYNTTGHFRLLSQLKGELKTNPLVRPKEGQTVGEVNRSKGLIRAMEARGTGRSRRATAAAQAAAAYPVVVREDPVAPLEPSDSAIPAEGIADVPFAGDHDGENGGGTFRARLNAIDLR